jgi:predicted porin
LLCTASFVSTTGAHADATDDLIDKLRAKGILTKAEAAALKSRNKAEQVAAVQAPPPAPPAPAPTQVASAAPAVNDAGLVRMMDKGVGVHIGPVDVKLSGEINGFYVYDDADKPAPNHVVAGGLASVGDKNTSAVRSGLLPSNFNIDITTTQDGIDVGAHFGIYPGINSANGGPFNANNGGHPTGLSTSGIDFRQQYVTIGTPTFGTVKAGRDIGLFAQEAILNDITLFGVGTPAGNAAPSNTSLGRIGLGYVYTDFQPQITYTTPTFSGFSAAIGVLQPLDGVNFSGLSSNAITASSSPQIQGKLAYAHDWDSWKLKLWANAVTESLRAADLAGRNHDFQGWGFDFGGKVDAGPATLVAYGYTGSGVGTTALFFDAASLDGHKRDSSGFYVQGQYNIGKLALGASYGVSYLDQASGELSPLLVKSNEAEVFQALYHLTTWDSLVGEFIHSTATAHGGNQASDNALALGTILFF